jgi:hypothetical protein
MSGYRLHIDIPFDAMDTIEAQQTAKSILTSLGLIDPSDSSLSGTGLEVNYRLGHDDDRQRSNYLDLDEKGHCSHRKTRIQF